MVHVGWRKLRRCCMFVHRMLLPVGCLLHAAFHRCKVAPALPSLLFGRTRPRRHRRHVSHSPAAAAVAECVRGVRFRKAAETPRVRRSLRFSRRLSPHRSMLRVCRGESESATAWPAPMTCVDGLGRSTQCGR